MSTQLTNHIAAEIRAEMARQRITQTQMAAALGMSQPALSRNLNGRALTVDFIVKVSRVLHVPMTQLIGDPDERVSDYSCNRNESSMLTVA